MQSLPLLPETAPFPAEQITVLNRIMTTTTAEQRAWLSGFLAGYQAATAGPAAAPQATPMRKRPLTILYATESGNAEALAAAARKVATRLGFAARVLDMADTTPADVAKVETLLVIASTWGEGEPPQRAAGFMRALLADDAPRFDSVRFAVLALGDRAYTNFCHTGRQIDERLAALGGTRAADRIECDVDYETAANAWIDSTLEQFAEAAGAPAEGAAVIHVDFAHPRADAPSRQKPFEAEITEHINLNSSRSGLRTIHVELSIEGSGISYEPGDAIGVVPSNDPELVEQVLSAAGLGGDAKLHAALREQYDIATLTRPQIESYAALTGDAALSALAKDEGRLAAFMEGRQFIDLLEAAPHRLSAAQLTGLLRSLQPRYYSVASSRKAVPNEAHLLVAAVQYETHGRARKGVASIDIIDRRKPGATLKIFAKPNPHFRLPADPNRKVIMVGPGTGVAPFRGFMQEREATGAKGATWLFFGNRNFTHDFLYQLEWQDYLAKGVLTRLDLAFSRDQSRKIYVQDRMWEQRKDLFGWLQDGAALYVCGDAKAMAKDVHATLLRIAADQGGMAPEAAESWLDGLVRDGRYLRDVY
jgi:sulfite reductase (NADPH) flavoprotein alpha-component